MANDYFPLKFGPKTLPLSLGGANDVRPHDRDEGVDNLIRQHKNRANQDDQLAMQNLQESIRYKEEGGLIPGQSVVPWAQIGKSMGNMPLKGTPIGLDMGRIKPETLQWLQRKAKEEELQATYGF